MDKWEHRTVTIRLASLKGSDGTKYHDWVAKFSDGSIEGLEEILNHYGSNGWKLVNLVDEYRFQEEVKRYRAVFKRRLESP